MITHLRRASLELPVRGLRLHVVALIEGHGDGLCVSFHRPLETVTVSPNDIIAQRRAHVLARAEELGNVAEACRQCGVSRTAYYRWKADAERYGIEALTPKDRRAPQMPTATPQHVVLALLTLAYLEPTLGPRQYADRLAEQGLVLGKTAVHKHLTAHTMGRASQRVARAAALRAQTSGALAEPGIDVLARREGPFGFCHDATDPGQLVALDSFYIGNLKGVGKIYQLTAVDTATRWAYVAGSSWAHPTAWPPRSSCTKSPGTGPSSATPSERCSLTRVRRQGLPGRAARPQDHPRPHSTPLAQPQRRRRALPRHDAQRVLAGGVPPRPLRRATTAAEARRRLADHLQHPTPQPQRLHARTHPTGGPQEQTPTQGIMTPMHTVPSSPRSADRKH